MDYFDLKRIYTFTYNTKGVSKKIHPTPKITGMLSIYMRIYDTEIELTAIDI